MGNIGRPKIPLQTVNRILLVAIAAINLWVIGLPLYSTAVFWWQKHINHRPQHLQQLIMDNRPKKGTTKPTPLIPPGEHLIIPSIALKTDIHEGASPYTLNMGVWHFPKGSTPDKTGNTVLIGHRFLYTGLTDFSHLDLVKTGDEIALWWNSRQYLYKVSQIKVVKPSDVSIIQPTKDTRLTMYTCTPMWTNKMRLAVIAEQEMP
jgi:LPXTG-site transpeptidase (sortase) family protein